jgi:hypothetical protein
MPGTDAAWHEAHPAQLLRVGGSLPLKRRPDVRRHGLQSSPAYDNQTTHNGAEAGFDTALSFDSR